MRQGMIDLGNIDVEFILLAEFLGVEKLLLAIRIRSYENLHPGLSSLNGDIDIAAAFDLKYEGIRKALSNGILPGSLTKEKSTKKQFAIIDLPPDNDFLPID